MKKGWYIKQSYENDFTHKLEELYKKYGDDFFSIQGIANKHMDLVEFTNDFFNKSKNVNVADISVDSNANVKEKNVSQYNYENNKSLMKLNSLHLLYLSIKKHFDQESSEEALEKIINGEIFVNDLVNYSLSYCFAFDLSEMMLTGMNFFKGNMKINPPKRSSSFINLIIQSTAFISNQIMGAIAYPNFFVMLDYFYRKEFGEDYIDNLDDNTWEYIKNQFQNFIYSVNFPYRGSQSAFVNISVMDQGFLESLFGGYVFPDGTKPNLHSIKELSKKFFEYFSEIHCTEGVFTFPVMTIAISIDDKKRYLDPDFVDWTAKANSEKSIANIFQSPANAYSSCCRLKNVYKEIATEGYQNSFGVGGLSIGSHRVAGINLPRLSLLEKENKDIVKTDLELVHKILYSHRKLIEERIEDGYLPLYTHNWMFLKKQYSTVGIIGLYEYVKNKNKSIKNKEGIDCAKSLLKTVADKITNWQDAEKAEGNIYNIEQIPGETLAPKLAEIDKLLGYNKNNYQLYSNQYLPLVENENIYKRFEIQGELDEYTSGGAILHINVDDDKRISPTQFKKLIKFAKDLGTVYFAVNYAYSECENGHFLIGKHDVCNVCESPITGQFTRVVGFITPVNSWNKVRREYEYGNRIFHNNTQVIESTKDANS